MNTKKQLDRLFKEQFRNMDVTPPPVVWENIAAALQNKKKPKRVVPLWYKLAGVAAALLIFFGLGSVFYSPNTVTQITSEDSNNTTPTEMITPKDVQTVETEKTNGITEQEPNTNASSTKTVGGNEPELVSSEKNTSSQKTQTPGYQNNREAQNNSSSSKAIVSSTETSNTTIKNQSIDKTTAKIVPDKEGLAQAITTDKNPENQQNPEATTPSKINPPTIDEEVSIAESEKQTEIKPENKKSLIEYIAEKNEEALTDSKPTPINRWEVAPNVAPVYYSSLGNGSSIDPQFSENSKSGEVNLSYGVKVSYAINDRLSVRSGVNKVDLSYSTNNIEFAIASSSGGLQSIDTRGKGYAIDVGTRGSLQPPPSNLPNVSEDGTVIVPRNGIIPGTMQQELDYFEVPLELKYNLLNKRFGLNVVGGMSTLFLNNNQVSVLSDGFQTEIGSANNLNSVSFSTNVGLGFDYKLSNRFVFNLEPMFKYQLNPYSDSSIDFKPFYLGVYSGFSYRF